MLKIGSEVGQPDTRYLSRSIVALNLERSWPRTTRVTLVWSHPPLPSPPSLHLEGTNDASFTRAIPRTPRVARSLFEVEALTGLRHQLHLPVCTCTSACDEQVRSTDTARVCTCVCVCVRLIHQTMLAAILSGGRKGNRESKIERRKNSSKTATMPTISRCWDAVVLQFFAKLCFRCNRLVLQGKWNIYFHYY